MADSSMARVLAISALSGTRTFAVPALVSKVKGGSYNRSTLARFLRSKNTARWLPVIAAGEIIADKFPIPNRVAPTSLLARAASGAVVALALAPKRTRNRSKWLLAGAGALTAVAGAQLTFRLRRAAHERLQIPSPVLGAVEDVAILATGRALLRAA